MSDGRYYRDNNGRKRKKRSGSKFNANEGQSVSSLDGSSLDNFSQISHESERLRLVRKYRKKELRQA